MIDSLRVGLGVVFQAWSFLLLVWVVLSWIPAIDRYHPLVQGVERIVRPTIEPFRRILPRMGPIDISPLLAIAAYQVIWQILDGLLARMSAY